MPKSMTVVVAVAEAAEAAAVIFSERRKLKNLCKFSIRRQTKQNSKENIRRKTCVDKRDKLKIGNKIELNSHTNGAMSDK